MQAATVKKLSAFNADPYVVYLPHFIVELLLEASEKQLISA